jgi:peroxiredoxin
MRTYLCGVFNILLLVFGCQPNLEEKSRVGYNQLEKEWSSIMQSDPSQAISTKWVERFWEFRNRYKGTSAATQATIKVFKLSQKILDFAGIDTKYKQLSLNDDALAELLDIIQVAAPVNDESHEWRRIVQSSTNDRVRIPAIFRLASYYFQFNEYANCQSLLDTLSVRYSVKENDPKYGQTITSMKKTISELSVGNYLPAFQCSDIYGKVVSSDKLKGKAVLLYFYGSGCGFCVKMYPTLSKLFSKYPSDKFMLLGVSIDKEYRLEKQFPDFLKRFGIHWTQTLDYRLFEQYNIFALSTSFLLDKQGKLVRIGRTDKVISSMDFLQGKSLEEAVALVINS